MEEISALGANYNCRGTTGDSNHTGSALIRTFLDPPQRLYEDIADRSHTGHRDIHDQRESILQHDLNESLTDLDLGVGSLTTSDQHQCSLCFSGESELLFPGCGHSFHFTCMNERPREWVPTSVNPSSVHCPSCRFQSSSVKLLRTQTLESSSISELSRPNLPLPAGVQEDKLWLAIEDMINDYNFSEGNNIFYGSGMFALTQGDLNTENCEPQAQGPAIELAKHEIEPISTVPAPNCESEDEDNGLIFGGSTMFGFYPQDFDDTALYDAEALTDGPTEEEEEGNYEYLSVFSSPDADKHHVGNKMFGFHPEDLQENGETSASQLNVSIINMDGGRTYTCESTTTHTEPSYNGSDSRHGLSVTLDIPTSENLQKPILIAPKPLSMPIMQQSSISEVNEYLGTLQSQIEDSSTHCAHQEKRLREINVERQNVDNMSSKVQRTTDIKHAGYYMIPGERHEIFVPLSHGTGHVSQQICRCTGGCRNARCVCVKMGSVCSYSCKCRICRNPFQKLVEAGVPDSFELKENQCFLNNLSRIKDMGKYLSARVVLPCCSLKFAAKDIVKGYTCRTCEVNFLFSWCDLRLFRTAAEDSLRHCSKCKKCVRSSILHCDRCGKCHEQDCFSSQQYLCNYPHTK